MKNIKTLLIEDNIDDVDLLKEFFSEAQCSLSALQCVDELSKALSLLEKGEFDVVLLDMSLPDSSGPETFYKLRNEIPETPIIVITGNKNEEMIRDLLQSGAQDYLIKGSIEPESLIRSINYAIERQRLLVNLNRKTKEIQTLREGLEHIVGSSTEAMVVVDQEGIICFVNPTAAIILDCEQAKLIGSHFKFPHNVNRYTELNVIHQDGTVLIVEIRTVEITWKNRPAYLVSMRDITSQKQLEEEMAHKSFHDSLTGLYNRAYFTEEMKRLDTGRNLPLCLIMGDVNNLKLVNDALGHSEGDRLLVAVAQILKKSCRKEDIVVRFGGDEFVILLPKCSDNVVARIIENIEKSCENITPDGIPTSISLGSATKYTLEQSISDLLDLADNRMYASKFTENKSSHSSLITMLEKSLYEKDYITAEHATRVCDLSVRFGNSLLLSNNVINELTLLASLHDIGKIIIPGSILKKRGPLTDKEWEVLKKHPETGYRITRTMHGMGIVAEDILSHHEKWDGCGYPRGLQGEQIPLAARILSIVDTFDVMTHERPYKKAMSEQEAIDEINRCSDSQFDPELAKAFIDYFKSFESINSQMIEVKTK